MNNSKSDWDSPSFRGRADNRSSRLGNSETDRYDTHSAAPNRGFGRRGYLTLLGIGVATPLISSRPVRAETTQGYGVGGYGLGEYGVGESIQIPGDDKEVTPPSVTTVSADAITSSSVTLNGELTSAGDAESTLVSFEYRETDIEEWTQTEAEPRTDAGTFTQTISELSPSTAHSYRAVAETDDEIVVGDTLTFSTDDPHPPSISTVSAEEITSSSVTLNGELTSTGDAESTLVSFEYQETDSEQWTQTEAERRTEQGPVTQTVSGLSPSTSYDYRIVAETDDETVVGDTLTFNTEDPMPPSIATISADEMTSSSATLNGDLSSTGDTESTLVSFEYRVADTERWNQTNAETRTESGPFTQTVSGLSPSTSYDYRAVANTDDQTVVGDTLTFDTLPPSSPSIDQFSVTDVSSPNPHVDLTIDWQVSDADGDLETVTVVVTDYQRTHRWEQVSVAGESASGTERMWIRHGSDRTYVVTLSVTDAEGNQTWLKQQLETSRR